MSILETDIYREQIQQIIKKGKENAKTGKTISRELGIDERKVRELVECLRADGVLIVNDQDGNGYYITDDPDVIGRQYNQMTRRALSILRSRTPFRKFLINAGRKPR